MLQLLCTAIRHHHCSAHSPAGIEDAASASHHDNGQDSSASLLSLPPLFCCSPATNGPVSSTCKAEECDVTRHNSTCAWSTGCAYSQAFMCVCEPATQLPHLHLASSCHSSSSRDQQISLPFWRHTHNAAPLPLVYGGESIAHCHPSQPPSNDALSPHTLP